MDLKTYYQRIREFAAGISGKSAVIVSLATPEGGRAGLLTEVPKEVAARMLADGMAVLAGEEETVRFHQEAQVRREDEERRRAAARIQVNVITEEQARALRPARKPKGS